MRLILLLLAVPAIASAQTTNTNCFVNGQWVMCNSQTQQPSNVGDTFNQQLKGFTDNYIRQSEASTDQVVAAQQQARRRAVLAKLAELIQNHQCDDAKALAIREGGLEAGVQITQLCHD